MKNKKTWWEEINTPLWTPLGLFGITLYWCGISLSEDHPILSFIFSFMAVSIWVTRSTYDEYYKKKK